MVPVAQEPFGSTQQKQVLSKRRVGFSALQSSDKRKACRVNSVAMRQSKWQSAESKTNGRNAYP